MWLRRLRDRRALASAIAHSRRLLAEGRHEENLSFLEGGVAERFSDDAEIRLLYGTALLDLKPEAGLSEIARAIELEPDEPVRLTRAARIMYDMKQFDKARLYTERGKKLAPEDFVFGPELLNLESNFAALDGEDERAEEGLRLAVEREPKMEALALDLARFLFERGKEAEALGVIDEALNHSKETKNLQRLQKEILSGA